MGTSSDYPIFIIYLLYFTWSSLIQTRTTINACILRYPHHPMSTHTSDSHQIPSWNKTKSKLQILNKKLPKIQILKFCKKCYMRHTSWSCLIKCINIKWIQPKLYTLQSRHGMQDERTDRRTNGQTERNQYTPNNFVVQGYKNVSNGTKPVP